MSEKKKVDYLKLLNWAAIVSIILIPIILYSYKFDKPFSNNQDIWGQFGSYISGVYTPLFSFLTLFLLYTQNQTQVKMNNYQREYNDVTQFRADAEFYLNVLDKALNEKITLQNSMISIDSIKNILKSEFSYSFAEVQNKNNLINIANQIQSQNQNIRSAWIGFNIALSALKNHQNPSFQHHYISVRLLPAGIFGFDCCVALDNYCYIQSDAKLVFKEYKSDSLTS